MAYNTKMIKTDVDKKPIPQIYNPVNDEYEVLQGANGAARHIIYGADGQPITTTGNKLAVRATEMETTLTQILAKIDAITDGTSPAVTQLSGSNITEEFKKIMDNIKHNTEQKGYIGDIVEPYEENYVGIIAELGLKVKQGINIDGAYCITLDDRGNIYVGYNGSVKKYSPDGVELWNYVGITGRIETIKVAQSGNVYVGSLNSFRIAKLDSNGIEQWCGNYLSAGISEIDIDSFENIYAVAGAGSSMYKCAKLSTVDGSLLWSTSLGGKNCFGVLVDNNYVYCSEGTQGAERTVYKLDQSNANVETPPEVVWEYTTSVYNLRPASLLLDNKDHLCIGAYIYSPVGNFTYYIEKLDQSNANIETPPTLIDIVNLGELNQMREVIRIVKDKYDNIYSNVGSKVLPDNTIEFIVPLKIYAIDKYNNLYGVLTNINDDKTVSYSLVKVSSSLNIKGYRRVE